jgi:hypothetical protein
MSEINYEAIADEFDLEQFALDEDSIPLGSTDEFLESVGIAIQDQDEYTIGEINVFLELRGMRIIEDHTQLFLHKTNP